MSRLGIRATALIKIIKDKRVTMIPAVEQKKKTTFSDIVMARMLYQAKDPFLKKCFFYLVLEEAPCKIYY